MLRPKFIIFTAAIVSFFDAVLKFYAINNLPSPRQGGFNDSIVRFALHKNEGVALGIPLPLPITLLLTAAILFFLFSFARKHWNSSRILSAFSIVIIIGATGNALDRLINGFTTDYIILFSRSAINLSDILIVLGTFFLLRYSERKENR